MFCSYRISTDKLSRGPSAIAEPLVFFIEFLTLFPRIVIGFIHVNKICKINRRAVFCVDFSAAGEVVCEWNAVQHFNSSKYSPRCT